MHRANDRPWFHTFRGRGECPKLRHEDAWIRRHLRSGRDQRRHVTLTPDKHTK